ncbi:MAG: hypothetical protein LBE49_07600 [Deltaproteobacteria bacterium]|jgi:hypothetical protein|nr:hypothetical protein [Deltaproteobacteria bacterium]
MIKDDSQAINLSALERALKAGPKAARSAKAFLKSLYLKAFFTAALLLSGAVNSSGAQAVGLGGMGVNVAANLIGVAKAVQVFAFVAGLALVVMGLMELYNSGRSHDSSLRGGVTKCAVGAALLAIDVLITAFSTTLFGSATSPKGLGGLGL